RRNQPPARKQEEREGQEAVHRTVGPSRPHQLRGKIGSQRGEVRGWKAGAEISEAEMQRQEEAPPHEPHGAGRQHQQRDDPLDSACRLHRGGPTRTEYMCGGPPGVSWISRPIITSSL